MPLIYNEFLVFGNLRIINIKVKLNEHVVVQIIKYKT